MVQSSVIILLAIGVLDATCGTHCPFPGLTTYAQRWHGSKSEDSAATWQNRRSFDSGEQFEFDCPRKSQVPDQKMIIVCQSDGTWSATLPRCDKRIVTHDLHIEHWDQVDEMFQPRINANCTELAQSRRYNISVSTETVQRVSYVEIRLCSDIAVENVTLDGNSCTKVTDVNQQDANESAFSCQNPVPEVLHTIDVHLTDEAALFRASVYINEGNHCGWPPVPVGGDVISEPIHGESTLVTYKCNQPLYMDPSGPQMSTCDPMTGQWTPVPKCLCSSAHLPFYVRQVKRTGNSIEFECDSDLGLMGNGTIECDVTTGDWNEPLCQSWRSKMNHCADPEPIPHTRIVNSDSDSITFQCKNNLRMIGSDTVRCDVSTHQWLEAAPFCTCRQPDPVLNAQMSWNDNESLTFQCDQGFRMFGPNDVTCDLSTGQWTDLPTCRRDELVLITTLIIVSGFMVTLIIGLVVHALKTNRWCCFWKPVAPWRHALAQLAGQYHVTRDEVQLSQRPSDDDYLVPLRADEVQEPIYVEIDASEATVHLLPVQRSQQDSPYGPE